MNFIGRGSAFNTKEGNNSAFIKNKNHFLLVDCGSDVFSRIMELDLLQDVKEIDVIITHLHPDHFGSLGDLIFYSYFGIGEGKMPTLTVHHYSEKLEETLENMGVYSFMYYSLKMGNPKSKAKILIADKYLIQPIEVNHYPANNGNKFTSIGFFLSVGYQKIYYSGDTYEIPTQALEELRKLDIEAFYQDVSSIDFEGNPHLPYKILLEQIPADLRHLVYCMHIDIKFDTKHAERDGFNVVERFSK